MTRTSFSIVAAALGAALTVSPLLQAADSSALANYFDNTWIWHNQSTKANGRIWLDRDGKFYVFYNMGAQSQPPQTDGPFQVQGRMGTYTLRDEGGALQLCLWPAAPRRLLGAERQHELFAQSSCYHFTPHQVGDVWNENNDPQNRDYKMWLVRGR